MGAPQPFTAATTTTDVGQFIAGRVVAGITQFNAPCMQRWPDSIAKGAEFGFPVSK